MSPCMGAGVKGEVTLDLVRGKWESTLNFLIINSLKFENLIKTFYLSEKLEYKIPHNTN
jgi:hypothetical protein